LRGGLDAALLTKNSDLCLPERKDDTSKTDQSERMEEAVKKP